MKLQLNASLGEGYNSASQWARRVTEGWALANLYCVACGNPALSAHAANRAVVDYHCPNCARQVQLKAKNGEISSVVANSAYAKKLAFIRAGRAPDYCFVAYNRDELLVRNAIWVPGHFITESVVSARKPLRAEAQRAGWIGSNIHLGLVPSAGKIPIVVDGKIVARKQACEQFRRLAFVAQLDSNSRGWLTDVMACVQRVAADGTFRNADLYQMAPFLRGLHPGNNNIEAKIRQQLQLLVSRGLLERQSPGVYSMV